MGDNAVLFAVPFFCAGEVALEAVLDLVAVGLRVLGPLDGHLLGGRVGHGLDGGLLNLVAHRSHIQIARFGLTV